MTTLCQGCSKVDAPGQPHDCLTCDTCSPIKVGAIFYESWGYDQTNIDFFQVVRVSPSGKTVWIKPIQQRMVESNGYSDRVVAVKDAFINSEHHGYTNPMRTRYGMMEKDGSIRKQVRVYDYGGGQHVSLNMTSYSSAYPWNGDPLYQTDSMAGH